MILKNPNGIPLCIALSEDATTIRSFKKSETQVYVSILNMFDEGINLKLLGYCPKSLPYPDNLLAAWQKKKGCGKTKGAQILRLSRRKMHLAYLDDILSPLLKYETSGLKLRVGGIVQAPTMC